MPFDQKMGLGLGQKQALLLTELPPLGRLAQEPLVEQAQPALRLRPAQEVLAQLAQGPAQGPALLTLTKWPAPHLRLRCRPPLRG
jgi:hypothetical protein